MAYSLGLTLYNLAARSAPERKEAPRPPRPVGVLVWLHVPGDDSLPQVTSLAQRLVAEKGVQVLLTSIDVATPSKGVVWQEPPGDTPFEARSFLEHWKPDIAVVSEGELRPSLINEADEIGIPLLLIDGRQPFILRGREGWWPGLMRGLLASFDRVLTVDEAAARAFRRAGARAKSVQVAGRLEYPSAALPCNEAERGAIAELLATRPVWFAAGLPEDEEDLVIQAHRAALKLTHRLLLIVAPRDPARAAPLAKLMEQTEGWIVAQRSAEEEPEPEVEAYVIDSAAEYGLWYRLAPITYLGGSLSATGASHDPMEAAALGSAMIHGPNAGRFRVAMSRLIAAGASCLVRSSAELADRLSEMLAPDKSAILAQAAWATASDGAEATDLTIAEISALLRKRD